MQCAETFIDRRVTDAHRKGFSGIHRCCRPSLASRQRRDPMIIITGNHGKRQVSRYNAQIQKWIQLLRKRGLVEDNHCSLTLDSMCHSIDQALDRVSQGECGLLDECLLLFMARVQIRPIAFRRGHAESHGSQAGFTSLPATTTKPSRLMDLAVGRKNIMRTGSRVQKRICCCQFPVPVDPRNLLLQCRPAAST
jgi:hypothetical protein